MTPVHIVAPWLTVWRACVLLLWLPWPAWSGETTPSFAEIPATGAVLAELRHGGFVLYLRHGATDSSISDRLPDVDFSDCTTQRPLTAAGRFQSAQVGDYIRRAGIPIAEFRASPYCRARETAASLLPGQSFGIDPDLSYTANFTYDQKSMRIAHLKQLLSTPVPAGGNRLLVAHAPNLADLIGYFPKELTLVVFRPLGENEFRYIASISPSQWPDLVP